MRRLALLLLLTGCDFEPLAYEANRPTLETGLADHDVFVYGEAQFTYQTENGNPMGGCDNSYELEGWEGDISDADLPCVACAEKLELAWKPQETSCEHGPRGAANLAILPMDLVELSGRSADTINSWRNAEGDDWEDAWSNRPGYSRNPVAYAFTDWTPSGESDTLRSLLLFWDRRDEGSEWARKYRVESWYYYRMGNQDRAFWSMELKLTR